MPLRRTAGLLVALSVSLSGCATGTSTGTGGTSVARSSDRLTLEEARDYYLRSVEPANEAAQEVQYVAARLPFDDHALPDAVDRYAEASRDLAIALQERRWPGRLQPLVDRLALQLATESRIFSGMIENRTITRVELRQLFQLLAKTAGTADLIRIRLGLPAASMTPLELDWA